MGKVQHRAILVAGGWGGQDLRPAHDKATQLFGDLVSPVTNAVANGYQSFFVAPDGSNRGWRVSENYDAKRDRLTRWLRANHYSWALIAFGDDEGMNALIEAG